MKETPTPITSESDPLKEVVVPDLENTPPEKISADENVDVALSKFIQKIDNTQTVELSRGIQVVAALALELPLDTPFWDLTPVQQQELLNMNGEEKKRRILSGIKEYLDNLK